MRSFFASAIVVALCSGNRVADSARTRMHEGALQAHGVPGEVPAPSPLPPLLVGTRVRVGGRPGKVFWDGRPEHAFISVNWSDDDSPSGVIPLDEVVVDEVANIMAEHASSAVNIPPSANVPASRDSGASAKRGNSTVYVGIISAPANQLRRQQVRERWLTAARDRFANNTGGLPRVHLEFVIGRLPVMDGKSGRLQGAIASDKEMALEAAIANEQAVYGDIARVAVAESYAELPDKVLLMLGLTLRGSYDFVVKVDDDQYLSLDAVLKTIEGRDPRHPLYSGGFMWDQQQYKEQISADGEFRKYYGGPCYMLSRSLVDRIAGEHFSHSIAYDLYGSTSEDVDMGRWVAFEDQLLSDQGARQVEYHTVTLSRPL